MSEARYQPVPVYPPTSSAGSPRLPKSSFRSSDPVLPFGPPFALKQAPSSLWIVIKYIFGVAGLLLLLYYAWIGAKASFHSPLDLVDYEFQTIQSLDAEFLARLDPNAGQPGTFFRDGYPLRSMLAFWELAEREVSDRGLDTCNGQLGRELVEAYHRHQLLYCGSGNFEAVDVSEPSLEVPATAITCAPVHHDDFSNWWPYPAAPCVSTNLRPVAGELRQFHAVGCQVTDQGLKLKEEMGRERFLGTDIIRVDAEECKERIEHTVVVIGRQDQWNPFHVAEDLITTLVSVFIAIRAVPDLVDTRVQLVFSDEFGMDNNHFTPLWDRIGAWPPKRLILDPWTEGTCLTNAIHSVGAGASLLSAVGVGSPYSCASTIVWAASHYYRHLFGLMPPSLSTDTTRRPINVLWISRAKLDAYAQTHNDWSTWRDVRHITNERELVQRLHDGLSDMCAEGQCVFTDARDEPETWALPSGDVQEVRFATIDPTVHAIETQIHFVGHTTILASSHGGALGLSLFLPPSEATIFELQVPSVAGNFHFQHMAYGMGHHYEVLQISRKVDVELVWEALSRRIRITK
ncbi:hypothetical protein BCR39DRAFT_537907 [Naematelia encephala]|uniref:Uncharacterized protein n=1 Tax=Naematelia encephala TaxID=71784 RepID=A0A1Y2AYN8_9TREE|nr:hypothetical protein BCR39DRAFT_537907 [Naematelia encephala]